jgi:cytochrome P450 family 6
MSVMKLRALDPQISKYFRNMVIDTVKYREKNNIKRNDFMQLLIQIKNKGRVEEDGSYLQQNDHGNLENTSGENGMFVLYLLHVNKCNPSCSSGGSALLKHWHFQLENCT